MTAATKAATPRRIAWRRHIDVVILLALALVPFLLSPKIGIGGATTAVIGSAALIANVVGMLLVYRSDGYLNFAQVQFGVFGAALFDGLNRGRTGLKAIQAFCTECVIDPSPTLLAINFSLALAAGILATVALSVLVQATVMQRMRNAPKLMATVITVFIAQALAAMTHQMLTYLVRGNQTGDSIQAPPGYTPIPGKLTFAGTEFQWANILLFIIILFAILWLLVALRRGTWGVSLKAVSTNPMRAGTLGINAAQVSRRSWALAGLLSATAAILPAIAQSTQSLRLSASEGDKYTAGIQIVLLVMMLTALVIARFESLGMVILASIVLSIVNEAVQVAFRSPAWMNVAYVVLIGAILLSRSESTTRVERDNTSGDDMVREVPAMPQELMGLETVANYRRFGVIVGIVAVLAAPVILGSGSISMLIEIYVFALVALSIYIITGWAGYVSFGQFGFALVGAWVAAKTGLPFLLALPVGVLAGVVVSVVLGIPAMRLRGLYLAIATIAFALSAQVLLLDPALLGNKIPSSLPKAHLFGFSLADERLFYYFMVVILAAAIFAIIGLRRSRFGRNLIALRSNAAAAQSFGVSPLKIRLTAFAISGGLAALAGVLAAFHQGRVAPEQFAATMSFTAYLNTLVGGLGGIAGPLLGAAFYGIVSVLFSGNPLFAYIASGLGAVLLLIAIPGGLLEAWVKGRDNALLRLAYRHRIPVPRLMGDGGVAASQGKALLDEKRAPVRPPGKKALPRYVPDTDQWYLDEQQSKPESDTTERATR